MEYLEFELPIKELHEQYDKCAIVGKESGIDIKLACQQIEDKINAKKEEIYNNLTPWQKVQLSRHPDRPYTLDYILALTDGNFIEIHGDRSYADDKAMVGGLGIIDGKTVMLIGQQKGKNTKERQYRRFGMSNPDGYRKALRLMRMAEKFDIPIVTFLDTPGAYPGLEAEERGQGEAIARNIFEMLGLKVPVVSIVIGEGASGGALGIGVGNLVYMMQYTWYTVISPESCSSILWRSWDYKEQAAENLKLTPEDMLQHKFIDGIIPEPLGGAHWDKEVAYKNVKEAIKKAITELSKMTDEELITHRQEKYIAMGVFEN